MPLYSPLAGGALPFLFLVISKTKLYPRTVARNLYHGGIATLTLGCILKGVLEIYGTTNALADRYWYVGIPMVFTAVLIYVLQSIMASGARKGVRET